MVNTYYLVMFLLLSLRHLDAFRVNLLPRLTTRGIAAQNVQIMSTHYKGDLNNNPIKNEILNLDCGVRVSRIITVSTDKFDAMLKLSRAKSRSEIMKIALVRHKRNCLLLEHQQLPLLSGSVHEGWRFEATRMSVMQTQSGTHTSDLWLVGHESSHAFETEVGSWLLASITGKDDKHMSAIFSKTMRRCHKDAQTVVLVRPGFGSIALVQTPESIHWMATYIELEFCDELGMPTKKNKTISSLSNDKI
jgi:hypothetical protein